MDAEDNIGLGRAIRIFRTSLNKKAPTMTVIIKYAFLLLFFIIYHITTIGKKIRIAGVPSCVIAVKKSFKDGRCGEIIFSMISESKLSVCPKFTRKVRIRKDKNRTNHIIIKNNLDLRDKSKSESMFDRGIVLI
jgi:hypothetical protein